ncbi:MAG: hypothetical protein IJ770_04410 [Alphaproteobacteria bacterium]|nr:hypothetical protein [Alphaproteobacteria bacterium]
MIKWSERLFWLLILFFCVWLNVHRFNHNTYANYEKAVDYGRVREEKEVINPVIAAVFYAGKQEVKTSVASYMNHLDNYNTRNVKMAVVPEFITPESQKVLEKLYREIKKHNKINYIVLVHHRSGDIAAHENLLRQNFQTDEVELSDMSENAAQTEKNIEAFLQDPESFVVFAADLQKDIKTPTQNVLINEAIYFAQKNHYKIHIFDEVDTQLAKAWEEDYAAWFDDERKEESRLVQQKNNLETYIDHYGDELRTYFVVNFNLPRESEALWPEKTADNYRLFDRGYIYVRFFTEGHHEIFSRAKVGKNKGVVVGIIEIARKAAKKIRQPVESVKIYLLTDLEKIEKDENAPLVNYFERDDGIYVQYQKRIALLAADERPENENDLRIMLWQRAQIPSDAADKDIGFYRFKTVEINYEN